MHAHTTRFADVHAHTTRLADVHAHTSRFADMAFDRVAAFVQRLEGR